MANMPGSGITQYPVHVLMLPGQTDFAGGRAIHQTTLGIEHPPRLDSIIEFNRGRTGNMQLPEVVQWQDFCPKTPSGAIWREGYGHGDS
jgi:hypothetical protein